MARALRRPQGYDRRSAARAEVARLLDVVKAPRRVRAAQAPPALRRAEAAIAIARALAGDPEIILADERVSALDVSVQRAIINLLSELQEARGMTLVFILARSGGGGVTSPTASPSCISAASFEFGRAAEIFAAPWHPYTEALLSAVPDPRPVSPPPAHRARRRAAERGGPAQGVSLSPRVARARSAPCAIRHRRPSRSSRVGHRIACIFRRRSC